MNEQVLFILDSINRHGEAYLVGGAVRDLIMGRTPDDYDVASSLTPPQLKTVFPDLPLLDTGLQHGTVTLVLGRERYEITSFRADGPYSDGRRPDSVRFSKNLTDDLARRDFSINAMAMAADGRIIDPFGGRDDLKARIIRAVGDPVQRFSEDALRLLRAVRFAARLDFTLAEETKNAILLCRSKLARVSPERIATEFLGILAAEPRAVKLLHDLGLLLYLSDELDACFLCEQETPWHLYNVGVHQIEAARQHPDLEFRLAALLHDVGKPAAKSFDGQGRAHFYGHAAISGEIAQKILRNLFLAKKQRQRILFAINYHDFNSLRPSKIARLVREEDAASLALLIRLQKADVLAQSELMREEKLARIHERERMIDSLLAAPHHTRDLALSGHDLFALGLRKAEIAAAQRYLLQEVMARPERNQREELLRMLARKKPFTQYLQQKDLAKA